MGLGLAMSCSDFCNLHFYFCRVTNNNTLQKYKGKLQSAINAISFFPLEIPLMEEDP